MTRDAQPAVEFQTPRLRRAYCGQWPKPRVRSASVAARPATATCSRSPPDAPPAHAAAAALMLPPTPAAASC